MYILFTAIKNYVEQFQGFLQAQGWNTPVGVLGFTILLFVLWFTYYKLENKLLREKHLFVQVLSELFYTALMAFISINLFISFVYILKSRLHFIVLPPQFIDIAVLWAAGWMMLRFIKLIEKYLLVGPLVDKKAYEGLTKSISKSLGLLTILATFFMTLSLVGIPVTATLFFIGTYIAIIIGAFILNNFMRTIYGKLTEKLVHNEHFLSYTFIKAIYWPLRVLVGIETLYILFNLSTINLSISSTVVSIVTKVNTIVILLLLAWFLIQFIQLFEEQLLMGRLTKKHPGKTTIDVAGKVLRVVMFVTVTLVTLPILGIPISGILAFGGGSAIVVGIALQPILANYFGGVLIYFDRFFKEGDWIYSSDKEIEGSIEKIGWRSTCIRTFDKRPLYVPNSAFSSISVVNASRMTNRRIKETIGIRYADASVLAPVTAQIRSMLQEHPDIDQKQTLLVHFTAFGPYSLNINVYTFTKTTDWEKYRNVQQDVFLKIIKIIESNGARLALPGRNVQLQGALEKGDKKL